MSGQYYYVRAIGGFVAIISLVAMVLVDFYNSGFVLNNESVLVLSMLIAGLLGVDLVVSNYKRLLRALGAAIEAYYSE